MLCFHSHFEECFRQPTSCGAIAEYMQSAAARAADQSKAGTDSSLQFHAAQARTSEHPPGHAAGGPAAPASPTFVSLHSSGVSTPRGRYSSSSGHSRSGGPATPTSRRWDWDSTQSQRSDFVDEKSRPLLQQRARYAHQPQVLAGLPVRHRVWNASRQRTNSSMLASGYLPWRSNDRALLQAREQQRQCLQLLALLLQTAG